jgi:hypothetical protein
MNQAFILSVHTCINPENRDESYITIKLNYVQIKSCVLS